MVRQVGGNKTRVQQQLSVVDKQRQLNAFENNLYASIKTIGVFKIVYFCSKHWAKCVHTEKYVQCTVRAPKKL